MGLLDMLIVIGLAVYASLFGTFDTEGIEARPEYAEVVNVRHRWDPVAGLLECRVQLRNLGDPSPHMRLRGRRGWFTANADVCLGLRVGDRIDAELSSGRLHAASELVRGSGNR